MPRGADLEGLEGFFLIGRSRALACERSITEKCSNPSKSVADRFDLMVLTLAGEQPTPPEPALPVNGIRHHLFALRAGVEAEQRVVWRLVAGKALKVDTAGREASDGAGFGR